MAELTAAETTADPCCAPEQQASCCEPSTKADCCGHEEGCGCAAGSDVENVEFHKGYIEASRSPTRAWTWLSRTA